MGTAPLISNRNEAVVRVFALILALLPLVAKADPPGVRLLRAVMPETGVPYTLAVVDALRDPGSSPEGRAETEMARLLLARSDEAVGQHYASKYGDKFGPEYFTQLAREQSSLKGMQSRAIVFVHDDPTQIVRVLGVAYPDAEGKLPYRHRTPEAPPEHSPGAIGAWHPPVTSLVGEMVKAGETNVLGKLRTFLEILPILRKEPRRVGATYELKSFIGTDPITLSIAYHALEHFGQTTRPVRMPVETEGGKVSTEDVYPGYYRLQGSKDDMEGSYRFLGFDTIHSNDTDVTMEISRKDWVSASMKFRPYSGLIEFMKAQIAGTSGDAKPEVVLSRLKRWVLGSCFAEQIGLRAPTPEPPRKSSQNE